MPLQTRAGSFRVPRRDGIDDVLVRLDQAKHLRLIAAALEAGADRRRHGFTGRAGDERKQRVAGRRAQALVKAHVVLPSLRLSAASSAARTSMAVRPEVKTL